VEGDTVADVAGDGAADTAGAVVAVGLAGINSGPFWPQPLSRLIRARVEKIEAMRARSRSDFTIRITVFL
jgi:hypothetical protein